MNEKNFWSKIGNPLPNGCMEWKGAKGPRGYGRFRNWPKSAKLSHRVMWELKKGNIPDGMVVMHKCDNPSCCNIDHLKLGTQKENIHDMISKGRRVDTTWAVRGVGENNTKAKLSSSDVRIIKHLLKNTNISGAEIGRVYGVGKTCISEIKRNVRWKHL